MSDLERAHVRRIMRCRGLGSCNSLARRNLWSRVSGLRRVVSSEVYYEDADGLRVQAFLSLIDCAFTLYRVNEAILFC